MLFTQRQRSLLRHLSLTVGVAAVIMSAGWGLVVGLGFTFLGAVNMVQTGRWAVGEWAALLIMPPFSGAFVGAVYGVAAGLGAALTTSITVGLVLRFDLWPHRTPTSRALTAGGVAAVAAPLGALLAVSLPLGGWPLIGLYGFVPALVGAVYAWRIGQRTGQTWAQSADYALAGR